MQHQQGLLIGRLDRHKPHRWACHGLTDGGCVGGIVFRPFDIALHIARRHQTHGVAELGDFTCPMMSGSASFHADQASRNPAKQFNDLLPSQLSGDDDVASTIHAVHLEYMLGEINADGANLHVDDPPPVIRCSTITLLAHSMPGAGVVHYIIFDRRFRLCLPPDVCFPSESDLLTAGPRNDAMGHQRTSYLAGRGTTTSSATKMTYRLVSAMAAERALFPSGV